ncbi:hypothetical protein [Amycolatopsis sp. lyj-108]|uniref:hypothetical protein n=1 Tax=Amycolatopsis sp. lyj-108 TaxID=2789286 RepID=UPI0039797FDA
MERLARLGGVDVILVGAAGFVAVVADRMPVLAVGKRGEDEAVENESLELQRTAAI